MTALQGSALWRKAAVLGSLWAASEIVVGSFLHNAHVPLCGNLLTGVGIVILVAGHRLWPERGLLWRAGLICAAMKSVSPSAVIMGPMIAISMEGALLDAGLALAGTSALGYVFAGGLAMSWPFFHKLGNILIVYGPDTVALYARGFEHLRSWLGLGSTSPWTPLALIWSAHFLGGGLAAALGLRVGRGEPARSRPELAAGSSARPDWSAPLIRRFSLTALGSHVLFVAAALSLEHLVPLWLFLAISAAYAAAALLAYPRAAAKFKRVGLWSGIMGISLLAGLVLGHWEAGLRMGVRALLLTVAFSCVGIELRNPRLRSWLTRRGGGIFFDALEQAFATLPGILAGLPPVREILRDPMACLRAAIAEAPDLLKALGPGRVFIITGGRGTGKSTLLAELSESLRRSGLSVGGILAPGFWTGGQRSGFDLVDLLSSQTRLLCRTDGPAAWKTIGPFRFSPEGLDFGRQALEAARRRDVDVLIVDEVGHLELEGQGWAPQLDALAQERRKPMVWVVRDYLVEEVKRRWALANPQVREAGKTEAEALRAEIAARP